MNLLPTVAFKDLELGKSGEVTELGSLGILSLGKSQSLSVIQENAFSVGDVASIAGWRRSPGEGNGNPLQCSCLGNPMNRGDWWATGHGVTRLSWT